MSGPKEPKDRPPPKQHCFYLIDEDRSAQLESYRLALRGLADIACNIADGEEGEMRVGRIGLHHLVRQLELRLGDILCDGQLQSIYLDRPIQTGPETFQ